MNLGRLSAKKPALENEAELIKKIIDANAVMMKQVDGRFERAQHPKGHGIVDGTFTVAAGIPEEYQVGLFASRRSFDAKIRFSNGGKYDDSQPDAHGMAIKLLDVEGPKLLDGMAADNTADFVLIDSETFFEGDLDDYVEFNEFLSSLIGFTRNRTDAVEAVAKFIFLRTKKLLQEKFGIGEKSAAAEFADQPPISPLKGRYWSATPYRIGRDTALKYEARPDPLPEDPAELTGPDGIGNALAAELESGPARFEFYGLIQPDWKACPADDPTISWRDKQAREVLLGTIDIPKIEKDALTASQVRKNAIRFNPWNTLNEHQPLGAINRARKIVYQELASRRLD